MQLWLPRFLLLSETAVWRTGCRYIELGNEQYNANYIDQVVAMEKKAVELGIGGTIHYMFPGNPGFLNATDIARAKQLSPRMDAQMLADIHIGGGGAVRTAEALFAKDPELNFGAVNAETNMGCHGFIRAMAEASDLNDWFNSPLAAKDATTNRLHFRTASFCMEDGTDFDHWDQGIAFFLPNQTWMQPPGYVHQMISRSWQPSALNYSANSAGVAVASPQTLFSAQKSTDGKTLVMRYINFNNWTKPSDPAKVTVRLKDKRGAAVKTTGEATMTTLQSLDGRAANPPGQPALISPRRRVLPSFADGSVLHIPSNSYVVVEATLAEGIQAGDESARSSQK